MADAHELGLTARARGFKEAGKEMDDLTIAARKVESAAEGVESATKKITPAMNAAGNATRDAGGKARDAQGRFVGTGKAIDDTGRKSKRAKADVDGLGNSFDGAGDKARGAKDPVDDFGDSADGLGKKTRQNSGNMRMFSMQLSQIGQQASVTGQPLQALAIQLPDLMLGFGTIGILAGAALGPLAMMASGLFSGGEEAATFEEKLVKLSEAHEAYTEAATASNRSLESLAAGYGALADEVERNLGLQTALAAAGVNAARNQAVEDLANRYSAQYGGVRGANSRPISELRQDQNLAGYMLPLGGRGMGRADDATQATVEFVRNLKSEFNLTNSAALDLAESIQNFSSAKGLEDQAAAAAALEQAMVDAAGGADKALSKFGAFLTDTTALSAELREQLGGGDIDAVLATYASRAADLAQLTNDRVVAEKALMNAIEANNVAAAERAEQAVDAIDEEIAKVTDADGRLEDMGATLLMLENAMARVEFDNEGELRDRVREARESLKEATENVDELDDADLSNLESALRGLESLARLFAGSVKQGIDELGKGMSLAEGASQYYNTRNMAPDSPLRGVDVSSAVEMLKAFEGYRASPYDDGKRDSAGNRVGEPIWRAGYGSDTVTLSDGTIQKVTQGMSVSVADANRDLARRVEVFQQGVIDEIGLGRWSTFSDNQRAAVTSIAYNYGSVGPEGAGIADELRGGDTRQIVEAIKGLAGHNGGINAPRRLAEAEVFGGAPIASADTLTERFNREAEQEAKAVATELEKAEREAEALDKRYQSLAGSLDAVVAVENKYKDSLATIAEAQAAGIISAEEAAAQRSKAALQREESLAKVAEEAEKEKAAYEALLASLDPLTAASMKYADALEVIDEALANGAISEQQAAEARRLAKADMDETVDTLNKVGEAGRRGAQALTDMFMSILDGSASGKDVLADLLRQIAQVQIAKSMLGLSEMGGATGGFFSALGSMLTMPSMDGGGYTGNGSRAGGLDGKGGFLAMMHPQESVIDHTKGAASGGGGELVDVRVSFDDNGNLQATIDRRANDAAARRIAENNAGFNGRVRKQQNDRRKK